MGNVFGGQGLLGYLGFFLYIYLEKRADIYMGVLQWYFGDISFFFEVCWYNGFVLWVQRIWFYIRFIIIGWLR